MGVKLNNTRATRGLTLVELLVVIVILGVLVAAVLPIMSPTTAARRAREASRGLNTLIALAQSKAVGEGRPYGIGLRKLSQDTGNPNDRPVCLEVFLVEQPSPYTGFSESSAVQIASNTTLARYSTAYSFPTVLVRFVNRGENATGAMGNPNALAPGWQADLFPANTVRPGDVLEIGQQRFELLQSGEGQPQHPAATISDTGFFVVDDDNGKADLFIARPLNATGAVLTPAYDDLGNQLETVVGPAGQTLLQVRQRMMSQQRLSPTFPLWTEPQPYRILRQPTPTSTAPYQLPEGTAIDLQASGFEGDAPLVVENNGVPPNSRIGTRNNDDAIFIMFSPDGSLQSVRYNRGGDGQSSGATDFLTIRANANLSLLVGLRENLPVDTTLSIDPSDTEAEVDEKKAKVNWLNLDCRWVTIGGQSGSVVTSENAFVNPIEAAANAVDLDGQGTGVDRLDIRREQIRRARTFVREMNREGGN